MASAILIIAAVPDDMQAQRQHLLVLCFLLSPVLLLNRKDTGNDVIKKLKFAESEVAQQLDYSFPAKVLVCNQMVQTSAKGQKNSMIILCAPGKTGAFFCVNFDIVNCQTKCNRN